MPYAPGKLPAHASNRLMGPHLLAREPKECPKCMLGLPFLLYGVAQQTMLFLTEASSKKHQAIIYDNPNDQVQVSITMGGLDV